MDFQIRTVDLQSDTEQSRRDWAYVCRGFLIAGFTGDPSVDLSPFLRRNAPYDPVTEALLYRPPLRPEGMPHVKQASIALGGDGLGVGVAVAWAHDPEPPRLTIAVEKFARKRGVGDELLQHLRRHLPADVAFLDADVHHNQQGARLFLQRAGFDFIPRPPLDTQVPAAWTTLRAQVRGNPQLSPLAPRL